MSTTTADEAVRSLHIVKSVTIAAPIEVAFDAVLDELGPGGHAPEGRPFPMTLEPWPGGRWFRDLGHHAGHFWGHVQVIKPPTLLELCGPLFMSYAAISHVQYRLTQEGAAVRLTLTHRAIGQVTEDHLQGVQQGWGRSLEHIRELALQRKAR